MTVGCALVRVSRVLTSGILKVVERVVCLFGRCCVVRLRVWWSVLTWLMWLVLSVVYVVRRLPNR